MRPRQAKIKIKWSAEFAYAIGLITTDGCLSPDGRHIVLVSKDREQLKNFLLCLKSTRRIEKHISGLKRVYSRVQLGDVHFYRFLVSIGLTPRKSKILGKIDVPVKYFFDFLKGHFDGDGTFYSYWDKRWHSSYLFYTVFLSASREHIEWIRETVTGLLGVKGHITKSKNDCVYNLRFAKKESVKILEKMYYNNQIVCLTRKREKIINAVQVENISI